MTALRSLCLHLQVHWERKFYQDSQTEPSWIFSISNSTIHHHTLSRFMAKLSWEDPLFNTKGKWHTNTQLHNVTYYQLLLWALKEAAIPAIFLVYSRVSSFQHSLHWDCPRIIYTANQIRHSGNCAEPECPTDHNYWLPSYTKGTKTS